MKKAAKEKAAKEKAAVTQAQEQTVQQPGTPKDNMGAVGTQVNVTENQDKAPPSGTGGEESSSITPNPNAGSNDTNHPENPEVGVDVARPSAPAVDTNVIQDDVAIGAPPPDPTPSLDHGKNGQAPAPDPSTPASSKDTPASAPASSNDAPASASGNDAPAPAPAPTSASASSNDAPAPALASASSSGGPMDTSSLGTPLTAPVQVSNPDVPVRASPSTSKSALPGVSSSGFVSVKRRLPKDLNEDGSPCDMNPWMAEIWPKLLGASSTEDWSEMMRMWGELELRLGLPEGGRVSRYLNMFRTK